MDVAGTGTDGSGHATHVYLWTGGLTETMSINVWVPEE